MYAALSCHGTLCHDDFGDARSSHHPNLLELMPASVLMRGILHLHERISVDMKERQYLARQYKQYTTYVVCGVKMEFEQNISRTCTSFLLIFPAVSLRIIGRISVDTTAAKVLICCFKKSPANTPSFPTEVVKRRTLCADAVERDPPFGWKNSFSFGYEKAVFSMGLKQKEIR